MLEDAKGINCQATNFYKAFSTLPEGKVIIILISATALGLLEPERATEVVSYGNIVQAANRFILEQISREAEKTDAAKCDILKSIFGFKMMSIIRCYCSKETSRESTLNVIDLIYSKSVFYSIF